MVKDPPETPEMPEALPNARVNKWAVQCENCSKWRAIPTQEEYEDIRCRYIEEPFFCNKKTNVTCDDPADIECDSSEIWVFDKPNQPKTLTEFKKELTLRQGYCEMDVYYVTPTGKRLRSTTEVSNFIEQNLQFSHLSVSDFSFWSPKIMENIIPPGFGFLANESASCSE